MPTPWQSVDPWGQWGMRFFQPKLRVYVDTGSDDEGEVDIFDDGALTATVNIAELRWYWSWERFQRKLHDGRYEFWGLTQERPADNAAAALVNADGSVRYKLDYLGSDEYQKARELSRWSTGLALGTGIGAPAGNSENGTESSSAPVILGSLGLFLEYDLADSLAKLLSNDKFTGFKTEAAGTPAILKPTFIAEFGGVFGYATDESLSDNTDSGLYYGVGVHVPFD